MRVDNEAQTSEAKVKGSPEEVAGLLLHNMRKSEAFALCVMTAVRLYIDGKAPEVVAKAKEEDEKAKNN